MFVLFVPIRSLNKYRITIRSLHKYLITVYLRSVLNQSSTYTQQMSNIATDQLFLIILSSYNSNPMCCLVHIWIQLCPLVHIWTATKLRSLTLFLGSSNVGFHFSTSLLSWWELSSQCYRIIRFTLPCLHFTSFTKSLYIRLHLIIFIARLWFNFCFFDFP